MELCKGKETAALRAAALRVGKVRTHSAVKSRLCVFCSSSTGTSRVFLSAALDLN